jgi:hypothetical protein
VILTRSDNHPNAATDNSHPDCRAILIQIVGVPQRYGKEFDMS